MNAPLVRTFGVLVVLFGVLVFFTAKWTVIDRSQLQDNPKNRRALLEQQRIARGTIYAADGSVLARSTKRSDGTYTRAYPRKGLFAHAVGYDFLLPGFAGLERFYNGPLTGRSTGLAGTLKRLQGHGDEGDDLRTSLDPAAQSIATQMLAGRAGAVVALDPSTGRVKVMASSPGYDPNVLANEKATKALNSAEGAPLLNRTTVGLYPPGSTMKVVTAIAAIDSGAFEPNSVVSGKSPVTISGTPLANHGGTDYGNIDLTTALTQSVNTVWAQVAEKLGKKTMRTYMDRLGFGRTIDVDLPADERLASGPYCDKGGKRTLVEPTDDCVDIGRTAIGQAKLLTTPLQMAQVAASVANGGILMRPVIATRALDGDGRTTLENEPRVLSRVMSRATADKVTAMMQKVVQEGTGTAAALQGIDVAGKTGTAEIDVKRNIAQPWFIAFAPASAPRVAIAVTLEHIVGGFGGTDAAPIAKAVMESLLQ
jgi:penicillin-binding protein A